MRTIFSGILFIAGLSVFILGGCYEKPAETPKAPAPAAVPAPAESAPTSAPAAAAPGSAPAASK